MLRRDRGGALAAITAGVLLSLLPAWILPAGAQSVFPALETSEEGPVVTVYSSLDIAVATPLIDAFQADNPRLRLVYHDLQTLDIYERVLRQTDAGEETADLVISSAMDLQMKLANDGYARRTALANAAGWPGWANWRDTVFALTYEPAVMVYHRPSFGDAEVPRTRAALDALLRRTDDAFFGRVATYDIERAGVGFLFLARDAEHHRDVWRLVRSLGAAGVKLYSNSSAILERVADGRFAIGYNILGSYATAWTERHPDLGIVLPTDYTVVMSRLALVRFSRMLGTLLAAGVPLVASLRVASEALGNRVLSNAMTTAIEDVVRGRSLARSLQSCGRLFPLSVIETLAVAEEAGRLDKELIRLAEVHEHELDRQLRTLVAMVEPLMLMVMAGLVGTIVIGMLLPIFSLQELIR